ncbi:hypothetical protein [Salinimonas lutimaris]|uniref:hypothetical protein n=1 Tax=Salinimonas lutimaris TaxID=914153 RepID=UPI0010C00AD3|nr:hypothetical protein [Salinimonas lutimaris]
MLIQFTKSQLSSADEDLLARLPVSAVVVVMGDACMLAPDTLQTGQAQCVWYAPDAALRGIDVQQRNTITVEQLCELSAQYSPWIKW